MSITRDALLVYFNQQATTPCPDTDLNGDADSPCNGAGTVSGTLPWRTMGISRDDAIDAYGLKLQLVEGSTAAMTAARSTPVR